MRNLFSLSLLSLSIGCLAGCEPKGQCSSDAECPAGTRCLVNHMCSAPEVKAAPPIVPPLTEIKKAKLFVAMTGQGQGQIISDPVGIACGATCTAEYPVGAQVKLSALPAAHSKLASWAGACTQDPCTLILNDAAQVTASFDRIHGAHAAPPKAAPKKEPQLCKSQCTELARACKIDCKNKNSFGSKRNSCTNECLAEEHRCKARAKC